MIAIINEYVKNVNKADVMFPEANAETSTITKIGTVQTIPIAL